MDWEALVRKVAERIQPGTLLTVATSDLGVNLCLDSDGNWHECYRTTDKNHGSGPIEKILVSFVCMRGYVRPAQEDRELADFARRVGDYIETNKKQLIAELMESLERAD